MAQQFDSEEGKSSDTEINITDLNALTANDVVHIVSDYNDAYLYESENKHNYSLKGIQSFRACTNPKAIEFKSGKHRWTLIKKGKHFLIKSEWRDAYLYDSEVYTNDDHKGIKWSFVATHTLAYRWNNNNNAIWHIEKAQKPGYFTIKSPFRNGYLYSSQRPSGYVHKKKDASMFACGHPLAPQIPTSVKHGKYLWKIVKVKKES